jgi:hypothetical protein
MRRNPVRSSQTKTNYKFHDVEESKYQEKEDDNDEGSSEGGVPCAALSDDHFDPAINDDIIKQTIFEEGSRVLVNYKGNLFMATIRRHREKSGKSEYLVHYDGNNKKTLKWIPVDDIKTEIWPEEEVFTIDQDGVTDETDEQKLIGDLNILKDETRSNDVVQRMKKITKKLRQAKKDRKIQQEGGCDLLNEMFVE